jgi:hypothetical protein
MTEVRNQELEQLLAKIMPVLERAVQGDYSGIIKMEAGDPLNEVYAGIQALIGTINDQVAALEEANARLYDYLAQTHGVPPDFPVGPGKNTAHGGASGHQQQD